MFALKRLLGIGHAQAAHPPEQDQDGSSVDPLPSPAARGMARDGRSVARHYADDISTPPPQSSRPADDDNVKCPGQFLTGLVDCLRLSMPPKRCVRLIGYQFADTYEHDPLISMQKLLDSAREIYPDLDLPAKNDKAELCEKLKKMSKAKPSEKAKKSEKAKLSEELKKSNMARLAKRLELWRAKKLVAALQSRTSVYSVPLKAFRQACSEARREQHLQLDTTSFENLRVLPADTMINGFAGAMGNQALRQALRKALMDEYKNTLQHLNLNNVEKLIPFSDSPLMPDEVETACRAMDEQETYEAINGGPSLFDLVAMTTGHNPPTLNLPEARLRDKTAVIGFDVKQVIDQHIEHLALVEGSRYKARCLPCRTDGLEYVDLPAELGYDEARYLLIPTLSGIGSGIGVQDYQTYIRVFHGSAPSLAKMEADLKDSGERLRCLLPPLPWTDPPIKSDHCHYKVAAGSEVNVLIWGEYAARPGEDGPRWHFYWRDSIYPGEQVEPYELDYR